MPKPFLFGGHARIRTEDLPIKSRLLYQLSYVSKTKGVVTHVTTPELLW